MLVLDDEDVKKIADGVLQSSPPAVVSSCTLLGFPLSDWVYVATIIYTIVGILSIIKRYWVDPYFRAKRRLRQIEERIRREHEQQKKDNTGT